MGRAPCCDKANVKKGPWSPEEDKKLKDFIHKYGTGGNWIALPHKAGLKRCGKSCRLRWLNYLRPNIKHGGFSEDEDRIICTLFATIGSRWSIIAGQLPGRTDNDIKNYWNTKLKKKLLGIVNSAPPSSLDPKTMLLTSNQQQLLFAPSPLTASQDAYVSASVDASTSGAPYQDPPLNQYHIPAEQSCSSSELSHLFGGGVEEQDQRLRFLDHGGDAQWEGAPPLLDYGNYEEINNLMMVSPSDYGGCSNVNDLARGETFMYNF